MNYNGYNYNSYLFVNGKEIYKFKSNYKFKSKNGSNNFPPQFCLGRSSDNFIYAEAEEVSLQGNVYDFPIDYRNIAVDDILDFHKYLMKKMR